MKATSLAVLFSSRHSSGLRILLSAILTVVTYINLNATVINVPADYPAIQQGIDASVDGDTVLVQPGTYVENVNFNGHNIVVGSLFLTTQDTSYISQTIIDGDQSGSVVTFENGENNTTSITAFTITNGLSGLGGGIHCNNGSSPNITYNIIEGNTADGSLGNHGGGVCCLNGSNPLIANNIISDNEAHDIETANGGGIYCLNSNPLIIDNIIKQNVANNWQGGGGGICCISSDAYIAGNIIAENSVYADFGVGGGIFLGDDCDGAVVENNIIEGNFATLGGGISCAGGTNIKNNLILANWTSEGGGAIFCVSDPVIMNNIVIGNWSQYGYGDGIRCYIGSAPSVINNIIRGNGVEEIFVDFDAVPQIEYNDIKGGWEGEGNIDCDPMFCDQANDNYFLQANSCCVGAGQDGVDIGAFGVGCADPCEDYVVGDFNGSGEFNIADIVNSFSKLKIDQPEAALICECPPESGDFWAIAADVNNSCAFNIADIIDGFSYLKTGSPELVPCEACPPEGGGL